jgi:hypothetical protein
VRLHPRRLQVLCSLRTVQSRSDPQPSLSRYLLFSFVISLVISLSVSFSFSRSLSLFHSLTHSPTHSLTHSLAHSLTHSPILPGGNLFAVGTANAFVKIFRIGDENGKPCAPRCVSQSNIHDRQIEAVEFSSLGDRLLSFVVFFFSFLSLLVR